MGSHVLDTLIEIHNTKSAQYGNSWCKRGEALSICANIARKVDRLENRSVSGPDGLDDTLGDLLVYLVKYSIWLKMRGSDVDNDRWTNATFEIIKGHGVESFNSTSNFDVYCDETLEALNAYLDDFESYSYDDKVVFITQMITRVNRMYQYVVQDN